MFFLSRAMKMAPTTAREARRQQAMLDQGM